VIRELKRTSPEAIIEILTPDFRRTQKAAVKCILAEGPDIFNHNVETVPALYGRVRPQGNYERSLQIFREIKALAPHTLVKSGLMLGLGETREGVLQVLEDLRAVDCDILTLGQYLQSSTLGVPVERYLRPDEFDAYKQIALTMGFSWVESGPFVRSSFHARESFESLKVALQIRRSGRPSFS